MRGLGCNCTGLGQLPSVYTGFFASDTFNNIVQGVTFLDPAVGEAIQTALQVFDQIAEAFGIGSGRREADVIVPVQNAVAARLGQVDTLVGHDAMGTSDLTLLNNVLQELRQTGQYFLQFISDKQTFTDGRASQQAANTIMPLIDGTGNYTWPAMTGTLVTTDQWGNPTNGGRIGAVARRIVQLGGTPSTTTTIGGTPLPGLTNVPPGITIGGVTLSAPMLLMIGVGAFLFFKKGK